MSHDVFISYATEDKITADAVCFGLEKVGVRCWMAPRDILPSDNFDDAIIRAIDTARVMVVIFSSYIFQSQYVKSEVEYAFSRNLIIAPFRIEAITPEGGLKLFLGRKHWLDAMTPPLENHIHKLASTIQGMLAAPIAEGEIIPQETPLPQPTPLPGFKTTGPQKKAMFSNPMMLAGLGVGILILVTLVILLANSLKGTPDQAKSPAPTSVAAIPAVPTQARGDPTRIPTAAPNSNPTLKPPTQSAQVLENTPATSGSTALSGGWYLLDGLPRNINDYEVDPANPRIIYAAAGDYTGAGGGVYKSEDGGLSWKAASNGLPNATVLAITTAQGASPVLLAALDRSSGIYSSSDQGATWTSLGNPFSGGGQSLKSFALSRDRKTIFGLVNYLGVMRSNNAGRSWTPVNEGLPKKDNEILVQSLVVDPTNPQILYAGTGGFVGQGAGVYKSSDGGETWTASNKGMLDIYITAVAVDPANGQVVYAGSGSGELFKSSDGGKNWTNLTEKIKLVPQKEPREIKSIQIDPVTARIDLAAANAGIIYSSDGGNKWRILGTPPGTNQPQIACMGVISGEKPVYLVAIPGVTTANAWRYGEEPAAPPVPTQPSAVTTPAQALVLSGAWENITDLPRAVNVLAANPANPKQVFAGVREPLGSGSLYKSEDGGITWKTAAGWSGKGVFAIAVSGGSSPTVYASSGSDGEVYASQDSGSSWKLAGKSLTTGNFNASLVAASSNAKVVYFVADPGLSQSDNGGQSWQPAGDGLPMDRGNALVLSIAIDPGNPKIVYAGTGGFVGQGQGVFKSTDGGSTWTPANRGMLDYRITALAVDPHQSQIVFAGSGSGDLFKSADGGQTWTNLTEKLKVIPNRQPGEIRCIQVDPITGLVYLAADTAGVLYSSDGGGKWRALGNPIGLDQPTWSSFSMIFGDKPVMFFATERNGVYRYTPGP